MALNVSHPIWFCGCKRFTRRRGDAERLVNILARYAVVLAMLLSAAMAEPSYRPPRGFVPDEETAVAIAEAVLIPIYGAEQIAHERPFHAHLNGNVWTVSGSLPRGWDGGVAVVEINKNDGKILRVYHGK